jgi:hypothetical protein
MVNGEGFIRIRSWHDPDTNFAFALRDRREPRRTLMHIDGAPAQSQIEYLSRVEVWSVITVPYSLISRYLVMLLIRENSIWANDYIKIYRFVTKRY